MRYVRGVAAGTQALKFDNLFREREFQSRHIGPRDHEQLEMLKTIGFKVKFNCVIVIILDLLILKFFFLVIRRIDQRCGT